jgi:hypothetical protein
MFDFSFESTTPSMIEMQITDLKKWVTLWNMTAWKSPFSPNKSVGHPCWPIFLAPSFILELFFDSIWLVRRPTSIIYLFIYVGEKPSNGDKVV